MAKPGGRPYLPSASQGPLCVLLWEKEGWLCLLGPQKGVRDQAPRASVLQEEAQRQELSPTGRSRSSLTTIRWEINKAGHHPEHGQRPEIQMCPEGGTGMTG